MEEPTEVGVKLGFKPERSRLGVDFIEDYATLGPEYCIPAVQGIGKVLRILRAARIAVPEDPEETLIGDAKTVTALLERALGTLLRVELKPRSRKKFVVWTDEGVETIEDVADVHETDDAFLVVRRSGQALTILRENVVRQQVEFERWYEMLSIERV